MITNIMNSGHFEKYDVVYAKKGDHIVIKTRLY